MILLMGIGSAAHALTMVCDAALCADHTSAMYDSDAAMPYAMGMAHSPSDVVSDDSAVMGHEKCDHSLCHQAALILPQAEVQTVLVKMANDLADHHLRHLNRIDSLDRPPNV